MKASNRLIAILIGLGLLVLLVSFSMTYSVRFNEVAIVTTFGEARGDDAVQTEPGLHFKLPAPIQATRKFDTRLQLVDTRLDTQATKDGLLVVVQAFVLWRIDDSLVGVRNFSNSHGSIEGARGHIEARLRTSMSAISQYDFSELIGDDNQLSQAEDAIRARMEAQSGAENKTLADMGIRIERVSLSQVLLPVGTTKNVIERMQLQRQSRAERVRDAGASEAKAIEARGTGEYTRIVAHAERVADKIRSEGDDLATPLIAILNQDPDFATFLIWLDALEETTASGSSTMFLPPTMPPFHLFQLTSGAAGIPQPQDRLGPGRATASREDGDDRIAAETNTDENPAPREN